MPSKKRGIFYTLAAISLTVVIFVTYAAYTTQRLSEKMDAIETRVETVNFFIKDVEKDLSKGAFIAGSRALLSFNQFIVSNGTYISNANEKFKEAFINGTLENKPLTLMTGSTFTNWGNRISAEASKVDIKFNFDIKGVSITQADQWSVYVDLNLSLDIRDNKNTSYWLRDRSLTTRISIIGLEDPLYVINSNGRVTNTIVKANITDFVVGNDVSNLVTHANKSYYIEHNDSPSFLMRLEGNLNSSKIGIESLVNLEKFKQQGLTLKDRSIVDYIYFGTQSTTNYRINNTPEWFKIDGTPPAPGPSKGEHLDIYQVRNMTI